jgi:hypothetical protein
MATMAGIGGLVGGLSGLFGGGGSSVPSGPPQFIMPGMGDAASAAFGNIANMTNVTNALSNTATNPSLSTFQNLYNNPGAASFLSGANTASGMGTTAATNAFNTGGALTSAGLGTLPWATSLINAGFDPQGALYNKTAGELSNAVNAQNAASGISTTPYGAGVANEAMGNFNINWQNNLLSRMLAGAQGAGGLLTQGGNLANLGAGIQNTAPGQFLSASGLPFGANEAVGGSQNTAIQSLIGNLGGVTNVSNTPIQDWLSYLQTGNQANSVANQNYSNQLQAQQQQYNQQMGYGSMLGGSLYGLGKNLFGGSGSNSFYNPNAYGGSGSLFGYSLSPTFGFG